MTKFHKIIARWKMSVRQKINSSKSDSKAAGANCTTGLLENSIDHLFGAINKSYHFSHGL